MSNLFKPVRLPFSWWFGSLFSYVFIVGPLALVVSALWALLLGVGFGLGCMVLAFFFGAQDPVSIAQTFALIMGTIICLISFIMRMSIAWKNIQDEAQKHRMMLINQADLYNE